MRGKFGSAHNRAGKIGGAVRHPHEHKQKQQCPWSCVVRCQKINRCNPQGNENQKAADNPAGQRREHSLVCIGPADELDQRPQPPQHRRGQESNDQVALKRYGIQSQRTEQQKAGHVSGLGRESSQAGQSGPLPCRRGDENTEQQGNPREGKIEQRRHQQRDENNGCQDALFKHGARLRSDHRSDRNGAGVRHTRQVPARIAHDRNPATGPA